ncbi:MAG: 50S ribosomal protein L10 [Parachlamydia sp.]|jgi:large subunit ribosomal protein L10|nr:50S ribosomal protein L10 [Parachlamydia sp.]
MRQEKQLLKQEIVDKIQRHPSFVIMQYAGLSANQANAFRRQLGRIGGDVEVVRKRVLFKAAQDAGIELEESALEGHIGLVFLGEDPIEATKAVYQFSQEQDKVIQVLGGRFDGRLYAGADVERLSKLPGKDEMRAHFLGTLEAPMSQTLAVVEALLASVAYCLDNKVKQASEGSEIKEEVLEN